MLEEREQELHLLHFGLCNIGFSVAISFPFEQSVTFRCQNFYLFGVVSDSVSKKFGIEKSIGFGIVEIWYRKKVSDPVSKKFGIGKSF